MLALKWFRATPAGDYSLEETVGGYHFALKNNFLMLGLLSSMLLSLLFSIVIPWNFSKIPT